MLQCNSSSLFFITTNNSPFGDLGLNLSDSDLRETVYQILVGACRSSGSKPLTFISNSERGDRNQAPSQSPSLHRSLTSMAASKLKKALGLKTSSSKRKGGGESMKSKRAVTTGELMRVQMRVSEQACTAAYSFLPFPHMIECEPLIS